MTHHLAKSINVDTYIDDKVAMLAASKKYVDASAHARRTPPSKGGFLSDIPDLLRCRGHSAGPRAPGPGLNHTISCLDFRV
jgi:hypothetical protein